MTINEIAKLANTSRGTVDRVINKRGKVSKEVEARVTRILNETGYLDAHEGKILSLSNRKILVSVIIASMNNTFFDYILKGIKESLSTLYRYSGIDLEIFKVKLFDDASILDALNKISTKSRLLMISSYGNQTIIKKVQSLNIPVICMSLDVNFKNKIGYAGCNFFNSGELAADMVNVLATSNSKVALFLGSFIHPGHSERLLGFKSAVNKDIPLLEPIETFDDDEIGYFRTKKILNEDPDVIVYFGGGMIGGLKAIKEHPKKVKVITVDEIPEVIEGLKTGLISASVSQHPFKQGKECAKIAYDYLVNGKREVVNKRVNCSLIMKDTILPYELKGENKNG